MQRQHHGWYRIKREKGMPIERNDLMERETLGTSKDMVAELCMSESNIFAFLLLG